MIWKTIPSRPNYEASDVGGLIRSKKTGKLIKPCSPSTTAPKYLRTQLGDNRKSYLISRLVCEAFHGIPEKGWQARHIDHNTRNNDASNVRWGTPKQNSDDKKDNGTHPSQLKRKKARASV